MSDEKYSNVQYQPSEADKKTIFLAYNRLQDLAQLRNRAYPNSNNRGFINYIDESLKRWNGIIPPRDDLQLNWQARVFNNFTRNAVFAFLSKVALNPPKSRYVATNKDGFQDALRAHILEKGVEYTQNRENGQWKFLMATLEMVTKGTVIAYEGYKRVKRKVQEIKKFDPITGRFEAEEREIVDYDDCFQEVIPLEDIYFGSLFVSDIQQEPDIIWKTMMSKEAFNEEYRKYPNRKYVKPGFYSMGQEAVPYYKQRDYPSSNKSAIEVLRWFRKQKDNMVIVANGALLYDGPFPFAHKMYPFAHGIFEPFAVDSIYGRSLPDKVASDQDVINTSWNMMLDQNYLSIYKPTLTDDPDYINEYPLQPGRMFPVTDIEKYKILDIPGPSASNFEMLQMAVKFANENSGNLTGMGIQQPKGKQTARQAQLQMEQQQMLLGLNIKLLENFDLQCKRLRAKNFLQFYPSAEKAEMLFGESDAKKKFIRILKIDDTELSDGTYGTSVIKIAKNEKNLPSVEDLNSEEEVAALQGENVEVHAITPDYIRNIDFDVQVVPESSYQQSKTLRQAMGMEFYQTALQNPLINQEENTRDLLKLFEKDSDRFMKKLTPPPEAMGTQQGQPQGQPQGTQGQISAQVRGPKPTRSMAVAMQ